MSTIVPIALPRRNRLLSSCAVAVIATLTVHMPVRAQAVPDLTKGFQGNGVFAGGAGGITTGTQTTTVTVNANRNIINWNTDDTAGGTDPIDFLPNGHTADFVNNSGRSGQDYIVLNRIMGSPNRPIAFNGTVRSTLTTAAGGARGGQVWFYSPTGIMVGATGSFNVGSLLLSAADITDEAGFLNEGNSTFQFGAADGSRAAVEVRGNITAGSRNAYVALIAPRVVQSGNVSVNGTAAYVAAEAATMTINGSLFDIQITDGTSVGGTGSGDAALVHDGNTTIQNVEVGYGESGYGDAPTDRAAIMVAVPKNDAVTMLVQGNVAYQQASDVSQVNGRIVLSAGHDVNGIFIGSRSDAPANSTADIRVSNGPGRSAFDADVIGRATGTASATAIARNETGYGGVALDDLTFGGALELTGTRGASLEAGANSRIDIARSLLLDVSGSDSASTARASLIARAGSDIDIGSDPDFGGGADLDASLQTSGFGTSAINERTAEILVEGGSVDINGNVFVRANARVAGFFSSSGGDAEAGTAVISLSSGSLTVGSLSVEANARGGNAFSGEGGTAVGGDGLGGIAKIEATGGTLAIEGSLNVSANALGGAGETLGGNAEGGEASVLASGSGAITTTGFASVEADAGDFAFFGGEGGLSDNKGGDALAGSATVSATGGGALTFSDDLEISATAGAGFGAVTGGNAEGGDVGVLASGGSIGVAGELALLSDARGGPTDDGVRSGDGQGGDATLDVAAGGSVSATSVTMTSVGLGGGLGSICCDEVLTAARVARPGVGSGGNGSGGTITATIAGALSTNAMTLNAEGIGGAGRDATGSMDATGGSDGIGGDVLLEFSASTSIETLNIDVDGLGGDGGSAFSSNGRNGGDGGIGAAGSIILRSTAGDTTIGSLAVSADGIGGDGGSGAFGGEGAGGNGGAGGLGEGGQLTLASSGSGRLTLSTFDRVDNGGFGFQVSGIGGEGGSGGSSFSGDGGSGGAGGEAIGGGIRLQTSGDGVLNIRPTEVEDGYGNTSYFTPEFRAEARGGLGGDGGFGEESGYGGGSGFGGDGGFGGKATGGAIEIDVTGGTLDFSNGDTSDPIVTLLRLLAEGYGGDGGRGGEGDVFSGVAGNGGRGGDASGGTASLSVADGSLTIGRVDLVSDGRGGVGGTGGEANTGGNGGSGGTALGGHAVFSLTGAVNFNQLASGITVLAGGIGGDGGNGGTGVIDGGLSGAGGDGSGGRDTTTENGTVQGGVDIILSAADVNISNVSAQANGNGGTGGSGFVSAEGIGSDEGDPFETAAGGAGGAGTGGTVALVSTAGINRILSRIEFTAIGAGGDGGGSESLAGGAGGKGLGGTISLAATETGEITLAGATLGSFGLGGEGGDGGDSDRGGNGGRGGDAEGGRIELATLRQGSITLTSGEGGGDLQAEAYARAGNAGNGGNGSEVGDTGGLGADGGDAIAGFVDIDIAGGTATLGDVTANATASGGNAGFGGSGEGRAAVPDDPETPEDESQPEIPVTSAPSGSGGTGTGGTIRIAVADDGSDAGALAAGSVNLFASGSGGQNADDSSAAGSAGTIGIFDTAGAAEGSFQVSSLNVEASGDNAAHAIGFELVTNAGRMDVFGSVNIDVDNDARLEGVGDGTIAAGFSFDVNAGGSITLEQDAGATVPLIQAIRVDLDAGQSILGATAGILAEDSITAETENGSISLGDLTTTNPEFGGESFTGIFVTSAGTADIGSADSASDLFVNAAGNIVIGSATAADDILVTSDGGTASVASATTLGEFDTESGYGSDAGTNIRITALGDARLDNGTTPGSIILTSSEGSVRSGGLLDAQSLSANAAQDIALTDVLVRDSLFLSANGSVTGRDFTSDGDISLFAGGDIALTGTAEAGGEIFASAQNVSLAGAVTNGTFTGGEGGSGITVFADDQASIETADSASFISVRSRGFSGGSLVSANETDIRALGGEGGPGTGIDVDAVSAGSFVNLEADAGATAGSLTASGGGVFVSAGGAAILGSLLASSDIAVSADSISLTSGTAARDIVLEANGAIGVTAAEAGDDFEATSASGSFTGGTITTTGLGEDASESGYGPGDGSNILVDAAGSIRLDNGSAPDRISLTARNGRIDSAGLIETTQFDASATSDIALTDVDVVNDLMLATTGGSISGRSLASEGDVNLDANGNVTVQEARAGDDISIFAGGTALVGAASAPGTGTDSEGDGFNIDVEAVGNVSFGSAETVGNLRLVSQEGGILRLGAPEANLIEAGGNVFVSAAFDLNLSAVNAGGDIALASQGAIDTGSLAAGDDLSLDAGGALSVDAATAGGELFAQGSSIEFGSVVIGGALNLDTPGALVLGTASAGSIDGSGSTITAGTLTTPGSITLSATSGEASVGTALAGSDIAISGASVTLADGTAGRDIRLASAGDIDVGSARAGDDFTAESGGAFTGTLVVTTGEGPDAEDGGENGYGTVAAVADDGSNITVAAAGTIALATGTAADAIDLSSSQASIASTDALTAGGSILGTAATTITLAEANAGQSVDLDAGGAIQVARIDAGGGVTLTSSGGAVLVSEDLKSGQPVDAAGRSVTLNAQGALAVRSATASAGNVALTSAGNLQVERADASAQVSASSGGTLGLTGQVNGTQISLASRDIAIGSNAQVGTTQRTTGIQITANGANSPVVIGGSATGSGYRLDNAEFGRLASRDVTISSQGESGSMQVDALTVRGAGAGNPNVTGRLTLAAGGDVEMTGRLAFDSATAANSVRVSAGDSFFADAAGAGIAVTNGSALAGSVDIEARSIVIASRGAAGELGSINNIDDRSDRLGQNDGTADNAGFVRADGIRLSASEKIHVQNSGINSDEPDDRAGLSAGAGGITLVTNNSTTPVEIIINGRQVNPAGGEFTGEALIDELTIVGANGGQANFAARSTVNGCLITGFNCGVIILPESPLTRAKDLIEELEQEDSETRPPAIGFSRLIDIEDGPLLSVVDEPVTGTGNEDIYLSEDALEPVCPDDRTDCAVDQPVTGTGNETLQSGDTQPTQLAPGQQQGRQPDANGPVTGTGNEALQSGSPQED
jgi:filamentous hemagglutinin family protein